MPEFKILSLIITKKLQKDYKTINCINLYCILNRIKLKNISREIILIRIFAVVLKVNFH